MDIHEMNVMFNPFPVLGKIIDPFPFKSHPFKGIWWRLNDDSSIERISIVGSRIKSENKQEI